MINNPVGKLYVGTMLFCFILFCAIFFMFGDSIRASIKFLAIRLFKPIFSTESAIVSSRTIFQEVKSVTELGKSGNGKFRISVPTYLTVVELKFKHGNNILSTYDANILYNGIFPNGMIKEMRTYYGSGPVSFQFKNSKVSKNSIPWFILGSEFDLTNKVDTGFLQLMQSEAFTTEEKSIPIRYLSFAPSWNSLEAYPPGLRLFLGQIDRFCAILIGFAMLGQLWSMGYRENFGSSRFTSWLVWTGIVIFVFIFFPTRSLPTLIKSKKYTSSFTIDESTLKQINLPTE